MKQNQSLIKRAHMVGVCVCSLFLMLLFAACSGVTTTDSNGNTTTRLTGSIQSVNASAHSVTINANGQTITVSGLTDQQITALQAQQGKQYSFQVTQAGNNTYNINTGSDPQEDDNGTPGVTTPETNGTGVVGSLDFIGKVQSANANSVVVTMPNNDTLTVNLAAQTDRSDFNGQQINAGQQIKVTAQANPDGSFTATKLGTTDSGDLQDPTKLNTVDFTGLTTSAVSNNTLQFKVGNKNYNLPISATTEIKNFASAQAIGANQSVKVEVLFNGSNGTVMQIDNGND